MEKANQALKQRFEKQFPGTKVAINAGGSDGAIAALLEGKIDLAAIGRPLTQPPTKC
jgi:phosphate transport system substrate-binding protein